MKVRAVVGFVVFEGGDARSISEEDVVEMPPGADWLKAGLVVPVVEEKKEKAVSRGNKKETRSK